MQRKRPITDALEQRHPSDAGIAAILQASGNGEGSREDDEPLHIVPIVSEEGTLQGYYVPVAQPDARNDPKGTVESSLTTRDVQQAAPAIVSQPAMPAPTVHTTGITPLVRTGREVIIARLVSVLLLCSIAFLLLATALYAAFADSTITITPREYHYNTIFSLHLVTGVPTSLLQVEARRLLPISLSQALTTQATGSYQQQPTYAIGYLTFYNGSFSSVTIAAGSQFTGQDGVVVVTTTTATVPGIDQSVNPPALGQASVAAQAAHMGLHGNIQAYDINGTCSQCGLAILMKNTQAFTGGQDAKTFTIVKQSDIDSVKGPLITALQQSMTSAIQGQARIGETLLPSPCAPTFRTNHHAGDEAQSVTLSASETCSGLAYAPDSVQTNIMKLAQAHAPGSRFVFLQAPDIRILTTTLTPIPTITATVSAVFVYLFTPSDRHHIAAALAGLKPGKAYQVLATTPGIDKATIGGVPYNCTLPTDTTHIIIRFLY